MNRKVWLILLLALCILAVPASAVEFDVSRYTMEELMDIQDIVEQRIRELKIQDAAENGDRSISFADSELLLYAGKTQAVSVTVSRRTEDAPKNTTLVWSSDVCSSDLSSPPPRKTTNSFPPPFMCVC